MIFSLFIITLIIVCAIIYAYFSYQYPDMTYVKSDIDNNYYLVRNEPDKEKAANTLASIRTDIISLSDNLYSNKDKDENKEYKEYITTLHDKIKDIILTESTQDSEYTSYSINKGEQIVFCLRVKNELSELHDKNLVMYVVLHEISHVACPEYGHGPLFQKIFAFLTKNAINIQLYQKIDFDKNPQLYCGLQITSSII